MVTSRTNPRLVGQGSPYLRMAAHQPVLWYPWGEEAFEVARSQDKPILLDIGAVWCHWCHVMDGESYEDADVAKIINDRFIAVKVDRDERPDVDVRYQKSVGAITGQGGWPLTGFLTPSGDVFYGGTYFPPEAKFGRPSFREVLVAVSDAYHGRRQEILAQASHVGDHAGSSAPLGERVAVDAAWIRLRIAALADQFDPVHGGWGTAPKFPHPSAVETLLAFHEREPDARVHDVIASTLDGMARGGVHDHLGGGFHRYSVDASWHVPHFEKMLYDNAEILRNYVHASRVLRHGRFAATAHDTYRFLASTLRDPAGGFRGSQDADVTFGDDGDFFTWTAAEIREAIHDARIETLVIRHFGIAEQGPMHHNPAKNVLHVVADMEAIAAADGRPVADVARDMAIGLQRLREAREKRKAPFIDPVLYANWNGMAIRAVLDYAAVLDVPQARTDGLRGLDRFLREAYSKERGFEHTIGGAPVDGLLDDQAQMLPALVAAFHTTQDRLYLDCAREVADLLIKEFSAEDGAGFVDIARFARREAPVAVLERAERPTQDAPSPSANARALEGLALVADLTGEPRYAAIVETSVTALAAETQRLGLFGAALAGVILRLVLPPAKAVVAGPVGAATEALQVATLRALPLGATLLRVVPGLQGIPATALAFATGPAKTQAGVLVCLGERCLAPAFDEATVRQRLLPQA